MLLVCLQHLGKCYIIFYKQQNHVIGAAQKLLLAMWVPLILNGMHEFLCPKTETCVAPFQANYSQTHIKNQCLSDTIQPKKFKHVIFKQL